MQDISIEVRNLYRAIGELAYVLAKIDKSLSQVERLVFQEAIKEELGKDSWLAKDRFEMLENQGIKADLEQTYNRVLFAIRQNRLGLNEDLIEKFIAVLEKVGGVSGITDEEIAIIERFREDVTKIWQQK
jgi:hypothetical protein